MTASIHAVANKVDIEESYREMEQLLFKQKAAFLKAPMPSAKQRRDNLDRLRRAIVNYKDELVAAVNNDFGNRSEAETMLAEVFALLDSISYNRKNLKKWMKPERRHVPLTMMTSTAHVIRQPLGVIGIVVPWNFPIFLCLSPLVSALASGNRAILKMSEHAPATALIIKELLASIFTEDEVAVVIGEVEVGQAFTTLPFDHLVFTGATSIGKHVMRAASENLTPVTLELGGKSPVIIHESFPIDIAAERIAFGKSMNTGQICVSPDYIFCPEDKVQELTDKIKANLEKSFPTILNNDDYTCIINDRQHNRLLTYLDDAEKKGANITQVNPANEDFTGTRKMPHTLVTNTTEDMLLENEEIFGPILPIKGYKNIEEALNYIAARPRPLALYYFDWNTKRAEQMTERTHSGGVCINDTLNHVMNDDLPFGGIGDSGIGHYHGKEGFLNFSKTKGVIVKGKIDITKLVAQPWGNRMYKMMHSFMMFRFKKNLF